MVSVFLAFFDQSLLTLLQVVVAFLVTAYMVLGLLLFAYWRGYLSENLIMRADKKLYGGNSRRSCSPWKGTIEEIVLAFSDQQLLTGLGILIAGFFQAWAHDLDVYHWNFVIYLAWLSSTVHLMTLAFLRDRFNNQNLFRNVRLCLMLLIFALIIVALTPTTTWLSPASPVRCFWQPGEFSVIAHRPPFPDLSTIYISDYTTIFNSLLNYLNFILVLLWRISLLFDSNREWLRLKGRAKFENMLERNARKSLRGRRFGNWLMYRAIVYIYIPFVVVAEIMDSFMVVIIALALTLFRGTIKIVDLKRRASAHVQDEESTMGFGQILPLLFFSNPHS
jgi:hypothetical protein